jgi:hypothetical protein
MMNKTMDKQTAISMSLHLLKQQMSEGALPPGGRELLASLLEIVSKTEPCIHCGKDPHA